MINGNDDILVCLIIQSFLTVLYQILGTYVCISVAVDMRKCDKIAALCTFGYG